MGTNKGPPPSTRFQSGCFWPLPCYPWQLAVTGTIACIARIGIRFNRIKDKPVKPDRLNLKMNGSYIAEMNEMEWGYRQSGSYSILQDTVRLDRPLYSDRDELIFHEQYIWSTDQHHLIPLENNRLSEDSAKWLEVGY